MPKYILGKDFHKNVGKVILMPHPTNAVPPVKLEIVAVKNKQVTLRMNENGLEKTDNYSKDKNKYLVIE